MRKISTLLYLLATTILLSSCLKDENSTVPADEIFQIYLYEYLAYEDQSYARATFRAENVAGEQVKLSDNASISVNDQILVYTENSGSFPYSRSIDGRPASLEFEYVNRDGKKFINTLYKADIDSISFKATNHTTQFSEDYTLHWKGAPVGANEHVILNIRTSGSNFITVEQPEEGATTVNISKHQLMQLNPGEHDMYLHRYKDIDLSDASAVGGMGVFVYSSDKAIMIVEN